jgi:glycosyltransferase involved in cell wall biosynthesis
MPPGSRVTDLFVKLLRQFSDRAVSNSRSTRSSFAGDAENDHRVIHNGIAAVSGMTRDEARERLGIDRRAPVVTLVGRINSWKGQGLLVEAAARLRFRHPCARYRIVGDAPPGQPAFERELDAMIARLELTDVVQRVGFSSHAELEFRAANVVVVPSTRPEPFGLVAVEAMAQSAPVIGARHGGLTEIIVENETGLFFAPGDVGELANRISTLLTDDELAEELGRNGKERQQQHFNVERYCTEFERLYEEVRAA